MANDQCPHCKGEMRTWTNKKKQRSYGRCKTCKKVVDLGKTGTEEKVAAPAQAAGGKTPSPARGTGRKRSAAGGGKIGKRTVQPRDDLQIEPTPKPRGFLAVITDLFNREW